MRKKKEVQATHARTLARRYAEKAGHVIGKFTKKMTSDPSREVYSTVCVGCGIEVKVEHYEPMIGEPADRGWTVGEEVLKQCRKGTAK